MPGVSAITQSRRWGRSPKEPSYVWATTRNTSAVSAKTWNGSRILRCMTEFGVRLWGGFRQGLHFIDRPNHIERALRVVLELVVQYSLAAKQRVFETHESAFYAGERFS